MNRYFMQLAALSLSIATGCSAAAQRSPSDAPTQQDSIANGRSIFQSGHDLNGVQITARQRPLRQYCAACHRPTGAGGMHFADGAVSADLRHSALVTAQKHPYNLVLLERAISTGTDNEGKPLDRVMPHWTLSKRDLHDVATYILTQLK